ncbi:MAG: HAD family hydrolase [Legionellales bacterium]|jgi:HAD superfamily hydrolase (TIGR01549 family)|nr:HAD family hydrolase [Legionellales bacterium]
MFADIGLINTQGVLIDLDDTIYSYQDAHKTAINSCWESFNNAYRSRLNKPEFYNLYQKNRLAVTSRHANSGACRSRLLAFQAIFEQLQLQQAFNLALEYEELYWHTLITSSKIYEEALVFLERCKKHAIPVCIITDMQAQIQIKKIQHLKINHLINYLVTSEEAGVEKPDKKIFQIALKKLNKDASAVIMIGDSMEKDIQGAQNCGIRTYQIRSNHNTKTDI